MTPVEADLARRALLGASVKAFALLVVALAVVVVIEVTEGKGFGEMFWSYWYLFLALPFVPVSIAIQYRRLRPRPSMSLEAAEMLTPPGPPCSRCAEVPVKGAPVCPSCHNLLRPLIVALPGGLILLGALLVLLYRRGAFTP